MTNEEMSPHLKSEALIYEYFVRPIKTLLKDEVRIFHDIYRKVVVLEVNLSSSKTYAIFFKYSDQHSKAIVPTQGEKISKSMAIVRHNFFGDANIDSTYVLIADRITQPTRKILYQANRIISVSTRYENVTNVYKIIARYIAKRIKNLAQVLKERRSRVTSKLFDILINLLRLSLKQYGEDTVSLDSSYVQALDGKYDDLINYLATFDR